MRFLWITVVSLIVLNFNLAAFAQESLKAEVFAGFSYANYELLPGAPGYSNTNENSPGNSSGRLGMLGWNGAVDVSLNRWFGFATDVSGYYSGGSTSTTSVSNYVCGVNMSCETPVIYKQVVSSPKIHNFLFGPQFTYPGKKFKPFAHLLLGGEHSVVAQQSFVNGVPSSAVEIGYPSTEFAMAVGGGVDYAINPKLDWRVQADYLTGQGYSNNNVRVSTGIVWHLGK